MQKLDTPSIGLTLPSIAEDRASSPLDSGRLVGRRLLVVVAGLDLDIPAAARRLLEVANAFQCRLLFLGVCADPTEEPGLQRQLVTLSALVRDADMPYELHTVSGRDWLGAIQSQWRQGDVLVCFSGQRAGKNHLLIGTALQDKFSSTVYVLDIPLPSKDSPRPAWRSTVSAWTGSLLILLAFYWLQVTIDQSLVSWARTTLLALSIPTEIWLVWMWNSITG